MNINYKVYLNANAIVIVKSFKTIIILYLTQQIVYERQPMKENKTNLILLAFRNDNFCEDKDWID